MNTDTYELILIVIGAAFTIVTSLAVYFLNEARKDANNSVPPEAAKTLGELIPPSVLPIILAILTGGDFLADQTETPADNELLEKVRKQLTPPVPEPTVSDIIDGAQG